MKKPLATALAIVACLTAGSGATVLAEPKVKKVETTVTLSYAKTTTTPPPSGPYGPSVPPSTRSVFSGKVKAKKGCKKGRDIRVTNTDTSAVVGTTTNSDDGTYSISLSSAAPSGTYQATAKKKKIKKKHGKKIVCKKGKSNTVKVQ
jgi:hypothetical protein